MFSRFGTLERVKSATGSGINIFFSEMNAVILNQVLYLNFQLCCFKR